MNAAELINEIFQNKKELVEENGIPEQRVFIEENGRCLVSTCGYDFAVWNDYIATYRQGQEFLIEEVRIKSSEEHTKIAVIIFKKI